MRPGPLLRGLVLCLTVASCGGEPPAAPRDPLGRAARFLWERQAKDGGWHSDTYGLLRSGQSLTPFVLGVLLRVPADLVPEPARARARARAIEFIVARIDGEGGLGRSQASLEDYPTYATSLATVALARAGGHEAEVRRLVGWLTTRQLGPDAGWTPSDPGFGAWGIGGPVRRPPNPGHVDLSMTRHALEALRASRRAEDGRAAFEHAESGFLRRVRGDDGGFHFSSVVLDANKAGPAGASYKSYGTTTADGILALLACDVAPHDPRVREALALLVREHRVDAVPGFPAGEPRRPFDVAQGAPSSVEGRWEPAMTNYYRAASAAVFARLGVREAPAGRDWRRDLEAAIAAEQRPDGSIQNASFLMKEDDPLIATTLALSALLDARAR